MAIVRLFIPLWHGIYGNLIKQYMPWYNGDYPPSYKNQPVALRNKATGIANELLLHGAEEGIAIATGLKRARAHFASRSAKRPATADGKKSRKKVP